MNPRGILIASAAAMLLISGAVTASADEASKSGQTVNCFGINSCKGQGSCKTAQNDCKGKNDCKSMGITLTTAEDCNAKGGKVIEASK
jgi:hypothetical protein